MGAVQEQAFDGSRLDIKAPIKNTEFPEIYLPDTQLVKETHKELYDEAVRGAMDAPRDRGLLWFQSLIARVLAGFQQKQIPQN